MLTERGWNIDCQSMSFTGKKNRKKFNIFGHLKTVSRTEQTKTDKTTQIFLRAIRKREWEGVCNQKHLPTINRRE